MTISKMHLLDETKFQLLQNALQIHKQSSCTWGVKLDSNLFKCFVKIPKRAFKVEQLQLQAY